MKDAIHLVKFKPKDIRGVSKTRKSFNCLVIGFQSSLINAFFDLFIQKNDQKQADYDLNENYRTVVRNIKEKHPPDKDKFI